MKNKGWIITAVVVGIIALYSVSSYNGLVSKEEDVDNKWAQIDSQLKRRADLIPNLVETVKGYASHEQDAIDSVTEARAALSGAKTADEKIEADQELSSSLSRLLVVAENYPDLKANQNYIKLMDSLEGTENRIAVARKDYNDQVTTYNKSIKKFPKVIFANLFGFDEKDTYEVTEKEKESPEVDFGTDEK